MLGPGDIVISLGTEFIDNQDAADTPADATAAKRKQDCELKAFTRLQARVAATFPGLKICWTGDAEFACGRCFQLATDAHQQFVFVLKPGRLPTIWSEMEALLPLCPEQRLELVSPDGTQQVYRWVHDLQYTDSAGRPWTLTAIHLEETKDGVTTTWAWVTHLEVNHGTVNEVATKGGRQRWHIENQGFNMQKNSGLNLEHVYSKRSWKAFYYLLQIGHMILQLVEKGSLLERVAREVGKTVLSLYGSIKNMAQRLLESFRYRRIPEAAYDRQVARRIQIRLDSS